MTVRLSAMFEEHMTAIIQNYNLVSKNVTNQPNTRSRRRFSMTEEEEEESTGESESEEEYTHTKVRNKRKFKASTSSNQSIEENSSSSSSSGSSSSDASDSSDDKPLQRASFVNGHKKQITSLGSDESENDSDYHQPLSNLKRKARGSYDNKKIVYNESSDDSDREMTINTRTRSTTKKRKRTITDSSDSDNVGKSSRDRRSVLMTVSSRGRVRKLTPKVRAFLEK